MDDHTSPPPTPGSEPSSPQTAENTCRRCAGSGRIDDGRRPCPECNGTGRVTETVGDA